MFKSSFEFGLLVNGKPIREYLHNNRYYVEGRSNSNYSLFFRNNTFQNIEVVFSVDGLDVLTGKKAATKADGYLIRPYGSLVVDGWRLNDNEVAQFLFSSMKEGYAAQKGMPDNIGVIAAAVFSEKQKINYSYSGGLGQFHLNNTLDTGKYSKGISDNSGSPQISWTQVSSVNAPQPGTSYQSRSGRPGGSSVLRSHVSKSVDPGLATGFGKKQESKVYHVEFERASTSPDEVLEIRYNNREGLQELGINVAKPVQEDVARRERAKPFEDVGGCEPPPNWKG